MKKNPAVIGLHIVCVTLGLVGFGWLCQGQISKFLSKTTSVSKEWQPEVEYEPPIIIFCPVKPFIDGADSSSGYSLKEFELQSFPLPELEFKGVLDWYQTPVLPETDIFQLYTLFKGNCTAFAIKEKVRVRAYINFVFNGPIDMFLIYPGEEIHLIEHSFGPNSYVHSRLDGVKDTEYLVEVFEQRHQK